MALVILWVHDTEYFYWTNGGHYYPYPFVMSALRRGVQDGGFLLVGVFFALSAYGCRKKLSCGEGKMTGFLQKRVKSVWMPFVLIGSILGLIRKLIWGGVTFIQLFLNCFDFNVWPVHWYIIFAILFYIAFYCVYSSVKRHPDFIMCAIIICYLAYCYITKKNELYYVSYVGLLVGLLYSKWECELRHKFTWGKASCVCWMVLAAAFLVIYNYPYLMWTQGINIEILNDGPVYRMLSVGLFSIFVFLSFHSIDFSRSKWLKFLGPISREIYLVHSFVLMVTNALLKDFMRIFSYSTAYGLKTMLSILFTLVLSLTFREVSKKITDTRWQNKMRWGEK